MKMAVFWVVAPYSLVEVYRCVSCAYCLHHLDDRKINLCRLYVSLNCKPATKENVETNVYDVTLRNPRDIKHIFIHSD
jgi:hypothetical protein